VSTTDEIIPAPLTGMKNQMRLSLLWVRAGWPHRLCLNVDLRHVDGRRCSISQVCSSHRAELGGHVLMGGKQPLSVVRELPWCWCGYC
jgi:hypothetical protein